MLGAEVEELTSKRGRLAVSKDESELRREVLGVSAGATDLLLLKTIGRTVEGGRDGTVAGLLLPVSIRPPDATKRGNAELVSFCCDTLLASFVLPPLLRNC